MKDRALLVLLAALAPLAIAWLIYRAATWRPAGELRLEDYGSGPVHLSNHHAAP